MTLVAAPVSLFPAQGGIAGANSNVSFTFDGSADMLAIVMQMPKSGTLTKIHYRITGVSSPVGTHQVSLQTVSATTGLPSGTAYASMTPYTVDASTYSANTNYATSDLALSVTAGDVVALVFDWSAYTSGSFTQLERAGVILGDSISSGKSTNFPYTVYNTTGSTAKSNGIRSTGFALEYSTPAAFVPVAQYMNWVGTAGLNAVPNTGTSRRGNLFTPTTPRRAIGIYYHGHTSGGDCLLRLRLASDDSVLATCTIDKDQTNSNTSLPSFHYFDSAATVSLSAGTAYRILMEGNDATGGSLAILENAPSAGALAILGGGTACYAISYNGSYSSTTTAQNFIGLITDQEDDGSGSGGGTVNLLHGKMG